MQYCVPVGETVIDAVEPEVRVVVGCGVEVTAPDGVRENDADELRLGDRFGPSQEITTRPPPWFTARPLR